MIIQQKRFQLCRLSMYRLISWFLFNSATSLSCHSARRACPELQNPLFQKAKESLHPWGELPVRADGGYEKMFLSGPQPMYATVATLFEGEGNLMNDGFCDFAFGFAQNDRGGKYTAKSESSRNRETNHREKPNIPIKKGTGAMCMGF